MTAGLAAELFEEAGNYLSNADTSPVQDVTSRLRLLGMLVAHLAQMSVGSSIRPATGLVGAITSASEGSVSVGLESAGVTAANAWYMMTTYGANFWNATAYLRMFRYMPGRQPSFDRARYGYGRWLR